MIKLVRKNQKILMVVFAVVLMVMFLSNLGPQGTQSNAMIMRQVATLDGSKITQYQLNNYAQQWQVLRSLVYVDPRSPNDNPSLFVVRTLGPELVGLIDQSQRASKPTPLFFLLVQEANRQGIVVSNEELESAITNNIEYPPQPGTEERNEVEDAVGNCLLIQKLARLDASVIKISAPYERYTLANRAEDFTLNVETIRADSLLGTVPNPTDAQIQAQFDKYRNQVAAVADQVPSEFGQSDNPLGFGYKIPNRVTVQYLGLSYADVRQATIVSKSDVDWYVAAFGEFKANRADYDAKPVPATQASASSTQPAESPRTLSNLDDDFALHAPMVREKLYEDQTRTRLQDILKEISERLSSGFGIYRTAVAANNNPLTGDAADFVTFKFMRDVAQSIHDKYGVMPILGNIQQPKSQPQLADLSGIGASEVIGTNGAVTFPMYAIRLFQPWITDLDKNSQLGALAIAQWQPSNPLLDAQQNVYVFRISGSDAAHVPDLADVRDQVSADCKIAAAYDRALKIGRLLLSSASQSGLTAAVAATKLSPPLMTDPFNAAEILNGRVPATIDPLTVKSDSARALATASQDLLITAPAHNAPPLLLTELPADRIVSVIELRSASPIWDADSEPYYSAQVTSTLEREALAPLELALFQPDAVAARLDYQPVAR